MAPGARLDYRLTKHLSLRAGPVEYLFTNFKEVAGGDRVVQNNRRVSSGVLFRF